MKEIIICTQLWLCGSWVCTLKTGALQQGSCGIKCFSVERIGCDIHPAYAVIVLVTIVPFCGLLLDYYD